MFFFSIGGRSFGKKQAVVIGVSKIVAHPALDSVEKGIVDVKGEEKKNLTVEKLVEMFSKVRKSGFVSDEALLS